MLKYLDMKAEDYIIYFLINFTFVLNESNIDSLDKNRRAAIADCPYKIAFINIF